MRFFAFFVCLLISLSLQAKEIRIRLLKNQSRLVLTGQDIKTPVSVDPEERVEIRLLKGSSGAKLSLWSFNHKKIFGDSLEIEAQLLQYGQKSLPPKIHIKSRSNGRFDVLADLDFEDYIEGVVVGEMPLSWPIESLKAQAVAARTYAYYHLQNKKYKTFDLDSSQMDQVYRYSESPNDRLSLAIDDTKGLILKKNNKPLIGFFHSDCGGGGTDSALSVWNTHEEGSSTTTCPFSPGLQWTLQVEAKVLGESLGLDSIERITIEKTSTSGRVFLAEVQDEKGQKKNFSGSELRSHIGYGKLKSAAFKVIKAGSLFLFRGQGFGHGVGLCQWGARTMAEKGATFQQILRHYYHVEASPETELAKPILGKL